MIKLTIDLSDDYVSSWISKNKYLETVENCSVQIDWSGVTVGGTPGVLSIELTNDVDDSDFVTVYHSFDVDAAASGDDDQMIDVNGMHKGLRICYVKNDNTGGTAKVLITYP